MKIQLIKSEYVLRRADTFLGIKLEVLNIYVACFKGASGTGNSVESAINNCWKAYNS